MELIDIKYLYDSGNYTKTIESGDTLLVGRPNSQRGDKYSLLVINQADLISQIGAKVPTGAIQLLGSKIGFDMNSISDQLISLIGGTNFVITDYLITNVSTPLTIADKLHNFTGLGLTGVAAIKQIDNSVLSNILPNEYANVIHGDINVVSNIIPGPNLYASLVTPQGAPATADIYVYGYILK